jgi:transposase-like protein
VDYAWAINHFKDLMTDNSITKPLSWVTDREIALMNCIDQLFPEANHLLCTWHVNMNILANCRKHYPKDIRDPSTATTANPQGYVPNPEWTNFLKDWASLLDSATEEEYTHRLTKFYIHKDDAVKYVVDTWLKWKEKLVKYWVDQNLHFGVRVTSPIEGCHAVLKAYLRVSTGDLKGVFDRLVQYWPTQHLAIRDASAQE